MFFVPEEAGVVTLDFYRRVLKRISQDVGLSLTSNVEKCEFFFFSFFLLVHNSIRKEKPKEGDWKEWDYSAVSDQARSSAITTTEAPMATPERWYSVGSQAPGESFQFSSPSSK